MRIGPAESGVLGGHAAIAPAAAAMLTRLLGDWRRNFSRFDLGGPGEYLAVDEAIAALHHVASADGNTEARRKPEPPNLDSWLPATEIANATGLTAHRIRQLARAGRVTSMPVNGRMVFPPETVEQVRTLRRAS
jgi:hypothetical protein